MRLGRAWRARLRVVFAWPGLCWLVIELHGRSGANKARGASGVGRSCGGSRTRVAREHRACVPHASGLFLGGPELGLAKVGRRCCGLVGGGLVGAGLVRRGAKIGRAHV